MMSEASLPVSPRSTPVPLSAQPLLLALGFAILVMISGSSVWLVAEMRSDSRRVMHTLEVKDKLSELQRLNWQTESDQRGYLLTGDERFQGAFRADVDAVRKALAETKAALAGSAQQAGYRQPIDRLDTAVTRQLESLEETAERRARGGEFGAPDFLRQPWSDEIRAAIGELRRLELDLLGAQIQASQTTSRLLLAASLFGACLIIVLAAVSVATVRRVTGSLLTAREALQQANESLEATVAQRTTELRQANEEIQHFAHIVSHDLRSPLVNIMGFTGELEAMRAALFTDQASQGDGGAADEHLAQEFDEALGFIKSSITRMDRLIKAILRLTREGRRELRMEPIDMTELARSAADGLGYQAQEAGASITVEPLPPCIGDRLALEQIVANLLENALKYLRDDVPGEIRVTGRAADSELVYAVHDNGRGIDPKDSERIFEIFRRSGPQDRPGEGIGLTHVRTLARRLGGAITLSSEPGRGSTFTVTLPRRPQSLSPETTP